MTLRTILVGFDGLSSQNHQTELFEPALRRQHGLEVVGVVAAAGEADVAAQAASRFGVEWTSSLAHALASYSPEAAIVCVRGGDRLETLTEIFSAGVHALVDKPLALESETAELIADAADRCSVVCMPAHHQRFAPAIRAAAADVASGKIGLPWSLQADFVVRGGDWVAEGELQNFGVYPIDVILSLIGQPVERVSARSGKFWSPDSVDPAHDLSVLLLDHAHGIHSTVVVGRSKALGGVPYSVLQRYRLSGTSGSLLVNTQVPSAEVLTPQGRDSAWEGRNTAELLVGHFVDVVVNNAQPALTARSAVDVARVIEAAQTSIQTGSPVAVKSNREFTSTTS